MNHTRRIVQLGLRRCFATESAGSGKTAENAVITLRSGRQFRRKEHDLITMEEAKMWKDMTRGEKIVYATKQTSYAGIILAGLGITGSLAYVVGSELFSSNNASGVYSRALTMVKNNQEVILILNSYCFLKYI